MFETHNRMHTVKITIEAIFKKQDVRVRTVFIWPKIGICGGLLECDKVSSGYITL
jgi:hypothetical protein